MFCEKYAEVYGKIFQLRIFGKTLVIINDSKLIRKAFASEEYGDIFNDRPENFIPRYLQLGFETRNERYMQLGEVTVAVRKIIHKCLKVFGEGVTRVEQQTEVELSRLITEINNYHGTVIGVSLHIRKSLAYTIASLLTGKTRRRWRFRNHLECDKDAYNVERSKNKHTSNNISFPTTYAWEVWEVVYRNYKST